MNRLSDLLRPRIQQYRCSSPFPNKRSTTSFVTYLEKHRDVYRDLRGFVLETHAYGALERDIARLETVLWRPEYPNYSSSPPKRVVPSDVIEKTAWLFVALDAHAIGNDTDRVLRSVVGLPWIPEFYGYRVDSRELDDAVNRFAVDWSDESVTRCAHHVHRAIEYLRPV